MGLITKPNATTDGTVASGAAASANWDTIYAEFNGNIDNNNIKAGAGIVDTKLAQISTAGKVATTALTGTISADVSAASLKGTTVSAGNINSATITTTTLKVTTVNATTINATTISGSNFVGTVFGTWNNSAFVNTTSYLAATDGFVVAYNVDGKRTSIKTDASNPPTTIRAMTDGDTDNYDVCCTSPVRKGDYWYVSSTNSSSLTISWLPLGV